jgi:hypothetical protein
MFISNHCESSELRNVYVLVTNVGSEEKKRQSFVVWRLGKDPLFHMSDSTYHSPIHAIRKASESVTTVLARGIEKC